MFLNYSGYKRCLIAEGDHASYRITEDSQKLVDFIIDSFNENLRKVWMEDNENFRSSIRSNFPDRMLPNGDEITPDNEDNFHKANNSNSPEKIRRSMPYFSPNRTLNDSVLPEDRPKIFEEYVDPNIKDPDFMKELSELFGEESIIFTKRESTRLLNNSSMMNISPNQKIFDDHDVPKSETFKTDVNSVFESVNFDKENIPLEENASFWFDKDEPLNLPTEITMKKTDQNTDFQILDSLETVEPQGIELQKVESSELNNAIMVSNIEHLFNEIVEQKDQAEVEEVIKNNEINNSTDSENLIDSDSDISKPEFEDQKNPFDSEKKLIESNELNQATESENLLESECINPELESEAIENSEACVKETPVNPVLENTVESLDSM